MKTVAVCALMKKAQQERIVATAFINGEVSAEKSRVTAANETFRIDCFFCCSRKVSLRLLRYRLAFCAGELWQRNRTAISGGQRHRKIRNCILSCSERVSGNRSGDIRKLNLLFLCTERKYDCKNECEKCCYQKCCLFHIYLLTFIYRLELSVPAA